ncbi:MAG: hypothetical protein IT305_02655 [Chloroflexi bacterium]|nr:hypothetical protein [Chloroflexota bacterium]
MTQPRTLDVALYGFSARVTGPPSILASLRRLFPPTPTRGDIEDADSTPTAVVEVRLNDAGGEPLLLIHANGHTGTVNTTHGLLATLEWAITSLAVEVLGQHFLLLHAGAVARDGRGMLLPGASGSGKSTLTAGLVAAGFALASDEVAMLDPATLELLPFARSVSVKAGARSVLAPAYPALLTETPHHRFGGEEVWFLHPAASDWLPGPTPVRYVVVPRYVPDAETRLEPLPRTSVLPVLLEQSFSIPKHGARGIGAATALLQQAECFALTTGDLDTAVRLLTDLVDGVPSSTMP